jgi:plastocyanin
MKVQATVLLAFQAKSLAEAGAVLDDVLARARERDDVDVGRVELLSPPGDRAVTLPPFSAPLAFDRKRASVQRGKFTLRLINRSQIPHNVTVAKGAKVLARTRTIQGATTSATANLPPGDYVFFCSVDAHRQAGMEGTLTVK